MKDGGYELLLNRLSKVNEIICKLKNRKAELISNEMHIAFLHVFYNIMYTATRLKETVEMYDEINLSFQAGEISETVKQCLKLCKIHYEICKYVFMVYESSFCSLKVLRS